MSVNKFSTLTNITDDSPLDVISVDVRPAVSEDHPYFEEERKALKTLKIAPGLPMIVAVLGKVVSEEATCTPLALQRVYLSPELFPDFPHPCNLRTEPLTRIYAQFGQQVVWQRLEISVRSQPNLLDYNLLRQRYQYTQRGGALLIAHEELLNAEREAVAFSVTSHLGEYSCRIGLIRTHTPPKEIGARTKQPPQRRFALVPTPSHGGTMEFAKSAAAAAGYDYSETHSF